MRTCTGCANKSAALDDGQAGGFLASKLLGAPQIVLMPIEWGGAGRCHFGAPPDVDG